MRTVFVAAVVAALTLPTDVDSQQRSKQTSVEGSWQCVRTEKQTGVDAEMILVIEFKGDSATVTEGRLSITGRVDVDPNANPPRITFNKPLTGKVWMTGIYRFDADTLVMCLWRTESERQATFDLPKQNPPGTVYTFRRAAVQKP